MMNRPARPLVDTIVDVIYTAILVAALSGLLSFGVPFPKMDQAADSLKRAAAADAKTAANMKRVAAIEAAAADSD